MCVLYTHTDLQEMLDTVYDYCSKWRLIVNHNKTQTMHMRKASKAMTVSEFKYGEYVISKTDTYRYFGFTINSNLDIGKSVEILTSAASRSLASITSKFYDVNGFDYETFRTLYNACVLPVMNYASCIWGYVRHTKCDTVQHRAMRTILGVSKVTPVAAMYGDLNWIPPYVQHKCEVAKYWLRLLNMPEHRLTKKVFNHDQTLALRGRIYLGSEVKLILEHAHLDIWENRNNEQLADQIITKCIAEAQMSEFYLKMRSYINSMSRLNVYKSLKSDFQLEQYVNILSNRKLRSLFAKSRMGTLPIKEETGRYRNIPRALRLCENCDLQEVECILHVLLKCPKYKVSREQLFNKCNVDTTNDNDFILAQLLSSNICDILYAVANFIMSVMLSKCNNAS